MEMSKSDFAKAIGVSPGRITQYITAGIITRDALVGEGRAAKVRADVAREQIRLRRHVGQSLGNGLMTHLASEPPAVAAATPPVSPSLAASLQPTDTDDVAAKIQLERLEQERRKNRLAQIDEARTLGQLVVAEDVQREIGKVSQQLMNVFLGMAPDIANAIASKFSVPQRDALHLVRQVMNEKRGAAAAALKTAGAEMPETIEVAIV